MEPCYRSLIGSSPVIYGKRIALNHPIAYKLSNTNAKYPTHGAIVSDFSGTVSAHPVVRLHGCATLRDRQRHGWVLLDATHPCRARERHDRVGANGCATLREWLRHAARTETSRPETPTHVVRGSDTTGWVLLDATQPLEINVSRLFLHRSGKIWYSRSLLWLAPRCAIRMVIRQQNP
ncbi:MAG: hypothetical protein GDA56_04700 [Hormoscilla sp. GM7CHS1pb]|nr:hypothetical protein [Hormoscilla sp. GM7CHS1pb]